MNISRLVLVSTFALFFQPLIHPTFSYSTTLGESLRLPLYLQKNYGDTRIIENVGPLSGEFRQLPRPSNSKVQPLHETVFFLSRPQTSPRASFTIDLAKAFFDSLPSHNERFRNAVEDLGAIRLYSKERGDYDTNLLLRIKNVFALRVSGVSPAVIARDPMNEIPLLWYQLKFEATDPVTLKDPPRFGEPLLLMLRQHGYYTWHPEFLTRLRRRMDLGHSALGLRYFGAGPSNDLIINPGSKNRELVEVALPVSKNPEVPNMVDVDNLWKWTETQLRLRFMQVEFFAMRLTREQQQALKVLLPHLRGLNFGPALAMTNNCADGAAALVNFLLPIQRTFSPKSLFGFGPAIPNIAIKKTARRFGFSEYYKFRDIRSQNPDPKRSTPGHNYKEQSFSREELSYFDEYLEFEKSL